jgi:hypothetical protein
MSLISPGKPLWRGLAKENPNLYVFILGLSRKLTIKTLSVSRQKWLNYGNAHVILSGHETQATGSTPR